MLSYINNWSLLYLSQSISVERKRKVEGGMETDHSSPFVLYVPLYGVCVGGLADRLFRAV